jgi:thiol:disulfide interchange protein DsbC
MSFLKYLLIPPVVATILLSSFTYNAIADETSDIATISANLKKRTPPFNVKSIAQSPIPGLYEVLANGNIYYMDKNVSYVIVGGYLYEDATKKNLTLEHKIELTKIKFDSLPLKNAIEIKKGTGEYKFAIFSDPDCPFCKSLEKGLDQDKVNNYTAYVFLFPLKELHPNAREKAETIWCAKDKKEAWLNWMVKDTLPNKTQCENPIESNMKLADELGVSGTPTIYLSDGTQTQDPKELFTAITGLKVTIVK